MWFNNRNLLILFVCQIISISGSVVMVTIGGILGARLSGDAALATLPVSLVIVGTASAAAPAAMLMSRFGRKAVFASGTSIACGALLAAFWAVTQQSFVVFCLALFAFGCNLACVQQYRFAASESVVRVYATRAISLVMLAPVIGALIGPELLIRTADQVPQAQYAGVFVALAGLMVLATVLLLLLSPFDTAIASDASLTRLETASARPFWRMPPYWLAVAAGVSAYGVMALIMTATPLSMHDMDGFSLAQTAGVIRSHVIAMYVPSLIFAWLVARFGVHRLLAAGVVLFFAVVALAMLDRSLLHYWSALVLLGIGWNFLYLGGTKLLTESYPADQRFRAQAVNEFMVFATSACASLLSGAILQAFGWRSMALMVVPMLMVMVLMLIADRRRRSALQTVASPVRS